MITSEHNRLENTRAFEVSGFPFVASQLSLLYEEVQAGSRMLKHDAQQLQQRYFSILI